MGSLGRVTRLGQCVFFTTSLKREWLFPLPAEDDDRASL